MKNLFLLILFLLLTGCGFNPIKQSKSITIDCPRILFAQEHKKYIDSSTEKISIDNLAYQAEINNAKFKGKCKISNNLFLTDLSILFVVNPLGEYRDLISLPFYIALIDQNNKLQDVQYFEANGYFNLSPDNYLIQTEIVTSKNISLKLAEESFNIIIGFMIDNDRLKLLN